MAYASNVRNRKEREMRKFTWLLWATMVVVCATSAWAHGGKDHGAKVAEGEVAATSKSTLTVETDKGRVVITVDDDTMYERDGKHANRSDLKVGDHVAVFGVKLGDGSLGATEVAIHDGAHVGTDPPHSGQPGASQHGTH